MVSNVQITKFIMDLIENKNVQTFLLWFYLVAFGTFIGVGDVLHNYWMPRNILLGISMKFIGLTAITMYVLYFGRRQLPIKVYKRVRE
jgi:hypothetical protein